MASQVNPNVQSGAPTPPTGDSEVTGYITGRRACITAFMFLLNAMNLLNAAAAGLEAYLVKQQMNNTMQQQQVLKADMDDIHDWVKNHKDDTKFTERLNEKVKQYDSDSQKYNAANTMVSTPVDLIQKLVSSIPQLTQTWMGQMQSLVQQGQFLADRLH